MNRSQAPIVITRTHVGRFGSYVSGIALLVTLIGLVWDGPSTWVIAAGLVTVFGIITWASFTPRDFTAFVTGRQARYGTIAFFSSLFLVGIVAMTYLLVRQSAFTFDMTLSDQFTLSPETREVLSRVSRPIQITGFYSARSLLTREIDDQFFRLYETATDGRIRRQYFDPDETPALAQRFGVTQDGMVFISYLNDDGSIDFNTLARVPRSQLQERDMTEAIMRLLLAGTITVYFDVSHSARDPLDTSPEGLSGIHAGIQESGLITAPLDIAALAESGDDIPGNAAAVLMIRPLTDYSEAEIGVIDRYLDRGGSLFIMTDVLFSAAPFLAEDGQFNQYLWANYGLRALDAAIVDPVASDRSALDIYSAAAFGGTVSRRFDPETNPALFRLARAVEVNLESAPANISNGRWIMSSELSFGETDLRLLGDTNTYAADAETDLRGPLTIAAWAWDQATDARILLVGDSDFVTNGMVGSELGNGILFTDGMTWLTGINESIQFAPVTVATGLPLIGLPPATRTTFLFIVVFLLPGLVLGAGLYISWRRGRQ